MARDFNGSSDKIGLGSSVITAPPMSIAGWIWRDTNAAYQRIAGVYVYASYKLMGLYLEPTVNGGQLVAQHYDGTINAVSVSTAVSTGQWYHVAGVFTSNTSRQAFLDGTAASVNTGSNSSFTADRVAIGYEIYNSGTEDQWFDGKMAEFGIWDAALTQAEITMLAAGYSPLHIRPGNLVHYMTMVSGYASEPDLMGGGAFTTTGTTNSTHPRIIARKSSKFGKFVAPVAAVTIPKFMHSYRQRRVAV